MTKKTKASAASVTALDAFHARNDGYANILTGPGTVADPTVMNTFRPEPRLDPRLLEAIFESDGVGRRIVEMPAEDMTREWLTITGDEGEAVLDVMEEMNAAEAVTEGATWARLYGGAVALFDLDDGLSLDQPVNPARIQRVVGMQIYDRHSVSIPYGQTDRATAKDPRRRLAGISEFYTLQPHGGGMGFDVHESRLEFFPGKRVPLRQRRENLGWDNSVLQAVYAALTRYGMGLRYSENILRDFVQAVLAVKGLTSLIASGNEETVRKRIALLDLSRSIINSMVIDADGEAYSKSSSGVAGLADILDRFAEYLATVTGIPVTKLFGRSAAGLNSTGENDMRGYYDMLRGEQRRTLTPVVNKLVKLIYLSAEGPTGGKEPDAWSIRWNSFYQPTEKEKAETRKIVAETDAIYIDGGVVAPLEVAESRFGQGEWSAETILIEGTEREGDASKPEPQPAPGVDPLTGKPLKPAPGEGDETAADAAPRSLYVRRDVLNRSDIVTWAKGQGLTVEKPEELHITIVHSATPVDWFKMGSAFGGEAELIIGPGGPRALDVFGVSTQWLVLEVASSELAWRNQYMRDMGAVSDFEEYRPHITLGPLPDGMDGLDLARIEPYRGEIKLGPEIFEEVKP